MRLRPFSLAALGVLLLALPTSTQIAPATPDGTVIYPSSRLAVDPVDGHVVGASTDPTQSKATSDSTPTRVAAAAGSLTIDPLKRYLPREMSLGGRGGVTGALYTMETVDGGARRYEWVTTDGQVTDLGVAPEASSYNTVAAEDVLAMPSGSGPNGYPIEWVDLRDVATQAVQRIPLGGLYYVKTIGRTVIAATTNDITVTSPPAVVHLLRMVDGAVRDLVLPAMPCTLNRLGDGDGVAVIAFCHNRTVGLIDLGTGVFTPVSQTPTWGQPTSTRLTPTHLIWYDNQVVAAPRSGGPASPVAIGGGQYPLLGMSGQWIVGGHGYNVLPFEGYGELHAVPAAGGAPVKLIDWPHWLAQLSDGTLLTAAGLPGKQGIYRIAPGSDGSPKVTLVHAITPADAPTIGLAVAGRRLATADGSDYTNWIGDRSLGVSGPFTAGTRRTLGAGPYLDHCNRPCAVVKAAGGSTAYLGRSEYVVVDARGRVRRIATSGQPDFHGVETRLSDTYFGYYAYGYPQTSQLIDLRNGQDITAPTTNWAFWGNEITAARADFNTTGVVTRTNLRTGAISSITTPGRCQPNTVNLQVVGRWLLWSCTNLFESQGVVDLSTGRVIPLPLTYGVLGDGYFIYRVFEGGIMRVNLTANPPDTVQIADVDDGLFSAWLGVRWAVDSYGGQCIAWTDDTHRIHIDPIGIATSAMTLLSADTPSTFSKVWQPTWTLSKPANWKLVVRSEGATVATLSGSSYGTAVTPDWAGATVSGQGMGPIRGAERFNWELTLTPADGTGPSMVLKGAVANGRDRLPPRRIPDGL